MAEVDPRVHSASEVHKRRAPAKVRPEPKPVEEAEEAATPGSEPRAAAPGAEPRVAAPGAEPRAATPGNEPRAAAPGAEPRAAAPGAEPRGDAASGEPATLAGEEPVKRKRWGVRIAVAAACVVVAGLLVFAGFTAGSRWLRYNDAHDMQGTWYVSGTDVPLTFTDSSIDFNASTSYAYAIDPTEKTITYSLGGLEGHGRYWFSDDRGTLIITDGEDYTMWSTLFDDLGYGVSCFFGNEELPAGEGSIVLTHAITLTDKAQAEGSGEEPESAAGEGAGDGDGAAADGDDFSGLAISDVLMKESDGSEEADEEGEWS